MFKTLQGTGGLRTNAVPEQVPPGRNRMFSDTRPPHPARILAGRE